MSRLEIDLKNQLAKIPDSKRTEIEKSLALFRKFDSDGDGKLDHEEFRKLLVEMNSRKMRDGNLDVFPDCDEDGIVSVLEFLAWIRGSA